MKKIIAIIMLLTVVYSFASAQTKGYFQQQVDNKIQVQLDDVQHILRGEIEITYTNNSPDTLPFIYFHLWPNAYSSDRSAYNKQEVENGKTDFYLANRKTDWGGIDSLSFTVNDEKAALLPTQDVDIVKLLLPKALLPNETITINTPFRVVIPTTYSRMGHSGQSYQITQWYPKPAVYDKEGWHPMPYLDQGEFYSEFGDFDVTITLPENYVLMATGNTDNAKEKAFIDSLSNVTPTIISKDFPASSKTLKTVRYTEQNIHDFAWFADKRWLIKKDVFTIPENGKEVEAIAAYFPWDKSGWDKSAEFLKMGVIEYSKKVGPYLYKTVKAVEGPLIAGAGMEYPTITIIIPSDNPATVREVIVHEVGHNWFYGMLANNERTHPWMDESINTYFEDKFEKSQQNVFSAIPNFFKSLENLPYLNVNKNRNSVPVTAPAYAFPDMNYGTDLYRRGSFNFNWLEVYMGTDDFEKGIHNFYNQYKLKHVYPEDFEKTMRAATPKNLDWFFGDAMNSTKTVDYTIKDIINTDSSTTFIVKNNSGLNGPAIIDYKVSNGEKFESKKVSTTPFTTTEKIIVPNNGTPITEAFISEDVPDAVIRNNYYRNGKSNHFRLTPFVSTNDKPFTSISVAPALGYNYYDGFMLGILLHNITYPTNNFEFAIAPMYGFGSRNFVGMGYLKYTQYVKSKLINDVVYQLDMKSFGNYKSRLNVSKNVVARYVKVAPSVTFNLAKPYYRSPVSNSLTLKGYYIAEQEMDFNQDPIDSLYRPSLGSYTPNIYGKVLFQHFNNTTFNPFNYSLEGQIGKDFGKIMATANLRVDYKTNKKSLYLRGFVGKFFDFSNGDYHTQRYYLTSSYAGVNDYLYDDLYIGRNQSEGFSSHQISNKEGGLKIPTLLYSNPLGMSNSWLAAVNIQTDLPFGKWPIRAFADIASFTDAKTSNPSGAALLYDAGLSVNLGNTLNIYVPLLYSKDYKDYMKSIFGKNAFWNTIKFELNLNTISKLRFQL